MRPLTLLACVAALAAVHAEPSLKTIEIQLADDHVTQLPGDIGKQYAIFRAESSASTATSFTFEHTKVTIVKHTSAESLALAASRPRAKINVIDAVAKGLVCLPKGSVVVSGGTITGGATSTIGGGGSGVTIIGDGVEGGVEGDKSSEELIVGQGEGITASVSSAASSAAGGGAAASSSASGGAAASSASSGGSAASSAAGKGSAASSAAGEDSAASSAASEGSAASSAASEGSAASSAASEGSAASSAASEGSAASSAASEGSAASSATDSGSSSSSTSSEGGASVHVSGGGEAAAIGSDGHGIHITGDGHYTQIDERFCECVPAYLCGEDGYINTAGAGLIDIRTYADKPTRPAAYASKCKADETCCKHRDKEPIGWLPHGCGVRAPIRLDKRIVRGETSQIGKYPWMVAIILSIPDAPDEYLCGGSLVREDVVLTGAHCVNKHKGHRLIVRVGEWDTCHVDEVYPHTDIVVSHVVTHEDFNDATLSYDVALLQLSQAAEISTHVNTICLPDDADHLNFDPKDCVATGWGKESFENSQYTNILKEVLPLHVVNHDDCQVSLRTTRLGKWFKLHKTFTCAGGLPGVDTCKGDGGSPLVCKVPAEHIEEEKFVQVGIVAWGIGCGKAGIPGVYADVFSLLPWIQEHLAHLVPAYP